MLEITPFVKIPVSELEFIYTRAEGPGGQNVNKVSTAVQLRFDLKNSAALPEDAKRRLVRLAGKRVTGDGMLVIEAKRYRTQEANRQDAQRRFMALLQKALEKPKLRRKTTPSTASKEERLKAKKRRGEVKRLRKEPYNDM